MRFGFSSDAVFDSHGLIKKECENFCSADINAD